MGDLNRCRRQRVSPSTAPPLPQRRSSRQNRTAGTVGKGQSTEVRQEEQNRTATSNVPHPRDGPRTSRLPLSTKHDAKQQIIQHTV